MYFIVIGALLGTQEGRKVEIVNTFELAMEDDGKTVDAGFLVTRREQCMLKEMTNCSIILTMICRQAGVPLLGIHGMVYGCCVSHRRTYRTA